MPWTFNPFTGNFDALGLSISSADLRYIKLDQTTPQTLTASPFFAWLTGLGDMVYAGSNKEFVRLPIGALNTVLHGGTTPSWSNVVEGDFSFTNITTANASTTAHGLLPVLSNNGAQFLNGVGNWTTPTGTSTNDYSSTSFSGQTSVNVVHNFGAYPIVQVLVSSAVYIPYTITHNSVNDFTVTFTSSTSGTILASLGSPQPMAITSVSNNYNVLTTDRIVYCTTGGKTMTLFTATGNVGHEIIVDNSSTGDITVVPQGGQTIEGESSQIVPPNSAMNIYAVNATTWRIY